MLVAVKLIRPGSIVAVAAGVVVVVVACSVHSILSAVVIIPILSVAT